MSAQLKLVDKDTVNNKALLLSIKKHLKAIRALHRNGDHALGMDAMDNLISVMPEDEK